MALEIKALPCRFLPFVSFLQPLFNSSFPHPDKIPVRVLLHIPDFSFVLIFLNIEPVHTIVGG